MCLVSSDDKNLPSVPPLLLRVPADYPDQSPFWADDGDQYGETARHVLSLKSTLTHLKLMKCADPVETEGIDSHTLNYFLVSSAALMTQIMISKQVSS